MTTQPHPDDTTPSQMTCLRRLYVLVDESGRTWLAAERLMEESTTDSPAEGGSMSHRAAFRGGSMSHRPDGPDGGSMSHLGPGDSVEVEGGDGDQVTVLLPLGPGGDPQRVQAYRVSPALLPTGVDPAS